MDRLGRSSTGGQAQPSPAIGVFSDTASLGYSLAADIHSSSGCQVAHRGNAGRTHLTVSRSCSPPEPAGPLPEALLFPLPTNKCRFLVLQPSIFMNWSNSRTRRLQQT